MSDLKKISEKLGSDRDSLYDSVKRLEDRVTTYLDGAEKEQKAEKNRRLKSLEDKLEASRKQVQAKFAGTTSSSVSGGKGFSGLLGGIGAGLGGALTGLAGVAALATLGLSLVDADKIKSNVETLLSIGDRYEGDAASIAARLGKDGAVIIGLNALGGALVKFAAGGAFNAGVDYFAGDWAENVTKNVNSILSIGDNFNLTTLKGFEDAVKAAALPAFLGALGKGLTLFALGGAATGTSDGINEFIGIGANNWAKGVKDNVETLLSINIGEGVLEKLGSVLKAGTLAIVMTELALGLGAFAVGGAATGISNFLNIGDDNWGETVKSNVESLLSIGNLKTATLKNVSGVMASLGAIGAGLALFGGGAAIAGVGQGVAEVQQSFSIKELKEGINFLTNGGGDGPSNWAEGLVKNVKTLLSIGDITNLKNVSEFTGAMTSIAGGLAVFGGGAAAGAVGVAIAEIIAGIRFLSGGEGEDSPPVGWVNQLKTDINNLLSIDFENAGKFAANMGLVAAGLGAFFGSQALSSVLDLGSKIIDFIGSIFTGEKAQSPIDQIVDGVNKIGNLDDNNITKLDAFAKGLDKLFIAFRQFGEANLGDAFTKNITKMVENIAGVLSMWPYLVNGGSWDDPNQTKLFGLDDVHFGMGLKKFLAAENVDDIETVDRAIRKLYDALDPSISISPAQVQPVPTTAGAGGGGTAVIGGNQTTNNTTTNNNIVSQPQPQVSDYYDETSRRYGRK